MPLRLTTFITHSISCFQSMLSNFSLSIGGKFDCTDGSNLVSLRSLLLGKPCCSGVSGFILSDLTTLPPHAGKLGGVISYW